MEVFEMRGNTLGVEATGPIAEALESQPHLKVVKIDLIFFINHYILESPLERYVYGSFKGRNTENIGIYIQINN